MTTAAAIPATAAEALRAGAGVYFTGKPCKNGHVAKRWALTRACDECRKVKAVYDRAHRPEYAARKRELRRDRWRKAEAQATARRKQNPENWPLMLLRSARFRAKKFGMEFSISAADIVVVETCPVLGMRLEMGGEIANSPSLDRVDNSRGYVPGNVRVISYRANALKRDASLAEVRSLLAYMECHKP